MQEYVIELSKYFIALFMVLYTGSCFYTFRYPVGEYSKGIFILQNILMFLVQVLCFLDLSLPGGDLQYLFFFAFILIFLFATITMVSLIYENINRLLLNNMCMLLGIGLCMVSRLSFDKAIRQYVIVLVSLIMSLFIPFLLGRIHFFKKITWLYATLGIGLLSTVLILGEVTHGSKISFTMGGITFQPSEFVKLACIIVTAKYLESEADPMSNMRSVLRLGILMGIPWVLTLAQGEMGSVLVMIFVFGVMMYFGGMRLRIMGGIIAAGVIGLALLYGYMTATGSENYRLIRILSFVNPELVDENAVYQVSNSKIAIGSGGIHGRGMFVQGSFSQLDYVPEDWTDFIFSTIGEAFGFVGCALVILTYLLIIVRMLYLARYTLDRFGQMVIIGVMAMLLFHVFENIGMTTGLMPITGIPLPFLSYGGSNMVTNMGGVALVLNVTKNRSLSHTIITPQTESNPYRFSGRIM